MANYCDYKVIVKGRKNACYAFLGSMSCVDDKWIEDEDGTDEEYTVRFEGSCKWSVDAYCTPWDGGFPVILPENADEAMAEGEDKYWYNTVQERSKMFEVEVWCNSADVEDYDPSAGPYEIFEHYINGEDAGGTCPEELHIEGRSAEDCFWYDSPDISEESDLSEELAYVKTIFQKYSDEELIEFCKKEPSLADAEVIVNGKPDRDVISEIYIDIIFDDGGTAVMDYQSVYTGDLERFIRFAEANIASLF